MRPIGVFGGTFDPIHYGHLRSAFEMLQALRFDEVRFVPCGDPPHRGLTYASAEQRFALVRLAIDGQRGFVADDRELGRDGPSYTVDTLASLRAEFSERSLGLIVGMDAFLGLPGWHRWNEILDYAHIVVAHRPGWKAPDIGVLGDLIAERGTHRIDALHETTHGRLHIHAVTQLEIASTEIRDLVAAGRDPRFLMPDAVWDAIDELGLYAAEAAPTAAGTAPTAAGTAPTAAGAAATREN
ncbi:MAG: nicotinate-nucleotide adenylyltransferase [Proteobacteria bacterium]|nr:nicotinate-nucleotide adenylyltransferase [Pseudomonadota bacterium]